MGDEDDITITGNCLDGVGFPDIPGSTTVSSTEEKNAAGHIVKITRRVQWTTPGEHTLSATCGESPAEKKIKVYKVDIEWNGQIVTGGTVPRIVGQPIALKAIIEPAPPAGTTYRWTVPDKCIEKYDMPDTLKRKDNENPNLDGNCETFARITKLPEVLVGASIGFYTFGVPKPSNVTLLATLGGRLKSVVTTLNVSTPTGDIAFRFSEYTPAADVIRIVGNELICGRTNTASPEEDSAVRVEGTIHTTPGGAGRIAFIQRIETRRAAGVPSTGSDGTPIWNPPVLTTEGAYVLDRKPKNINSSDDMVPQFQAKIKVIGESATETIEVLDSPSVFLSGVATAFDIREFFEMFLMYQPTGGIWVTIHKARWRWSAAGSRAPGQPWVWSHRTPPSAVNSPDGPSEQLPTWETRIQDIAA
ncbi:hypothetical protein A6X21_16040 [Planctopirus hydrillae]|uniref:Uncharacterized protein n=1 Tax=Planctopirus hydrillae TaxID=1841610 RepID=A0A1C3ET45_9PLAN|nr:hypothetical protein A6X21_16040 [Planctopirus hydrillae]